MRHCADVTVAFSCPEVQPCSSSPLFSRCPAVVVALYVMVDTVVPGSVARSTSNLTHLTVLTAQNRDDDPAHEGFYSRGLYTFVVQWES